MTLLQKVLLEATDAAAAPDGDARLLAGLRAMQTAGTDQEELLTTAEVCAALKCSRATIQRLAPPRHAMGGQNRYVLSEVKAYLQKRSAS